MTRRCNIASQGQYIFLSIVLTAYDKHVYYNCSIVSVGTVVDCNKSNDSFSVPLSFFALKFVPCISQSHNDCGIVQC